MQTFERLISCRKDEAGDAKDYRFGTRVGLGLTMPVYLRE